MKKRRNVNTSLELFLDTICNVFGGVIFIALLIAILVQQTIGNIKLPEGASPEEIAKLRQELDQISSEITGSRALLETLQKAMPRPHDPADRERAELFYELSEAKGAALEKEAKLLNQRLALEKEMLDWENKIKTATATLQQKQSERQKLNQDIADITKLQSEIDTLNRQIAQRAGSAQRVETIYMPRLRPANPNNRRVDVVLQSGRFRYQSAPENTGIPVNDTVSSKRQIRQELTQNHNRNNEYLVVRVYEDSVEQWHIIRDQIVDASFQYQLIPTRTPPPPRPVEQRPPQNQRPTANPGGGSGSGGGIGTGTGAGTGAGTATRPARPSCNCGNPWCTICNPPGGGGGAPLVQ